MATSTTVNATLAGGHDNPPSAGGGGGGGSRTVSSSPWSQIVRGDSPDAIASSGAIATPSATPPPLQVVASSSAAAEDEGCDNGGNAGKRAVWNRPVNGDVEIRGVMGADSWPALTDSARVSASKSVSDGSSSSLSETVPLGSGSGSPLQVSHNADGDSNLNTPNHTTSGRQRSMRHNGSGSGANEASPNGGAHTQQPGSQRPHVGDVNLSNPSPRDHAGQRIRQSRRGNDYPQRSNSFRRNGGPHVRDGSHHHNFGGRRDQDHSSSDWNNHRNFNSRDGHMHPQRGVPRFMRHPPPPPPLPTTSAAFIVPPAFQAFGGLIGFPGEVPPPVYYVPGPPVPIVAQGPPLYFAPPDPQLHSKIMSQIEYYFSNDNLIKDTFLRQNMDDQGWVPIKLIAGFNKVSYLTNNIQLIMESIKNSSIVELQDDKIRRRNDWMRWVMPPSVQIPTVSGLPSLSRSTQDTLAAHVQSISLEDNSTSHSSRRSQAGVNDVGVLSRSSSGSGNFNSESQVSSFDGMSQVSLQGGGSTSMRNPSG